MSITTPFGCLRRCHIIHFVLLLLLLLLPPPPLVLPIKGIGTDNEL
jgi:hypothetical protein